MNRDLIENYVLSSNNYTRQLGPYFVPNYTITPSGKIINITNNRRTELYKPDSRYVTSFKKDLDEYSDYVCRDLKSLISNYIEEFPIVIDNLQLWSDILDYYKFPPNSKERNVRYFLLDFFFYEAGFIVEIDSNYHTDRLIYDNARDRYLEIRYGIITLRFKNYGSSLLERGKYFDIFDCRLQDSYRDKKYTNSIGRYYPINQSKTVIDFFIKENHAILTFIENLMSYIDNSMLLSGIAITMKDVDRVSPKDLGTLCNPDQIDIFLDKVSYLMEDIFNKKLYIHNTTEYSVYDVLGILDISKEDCKWDIILDTVGKKIPRWIIKLLGDFPLGNKYLSEAIDVDSVSDFEILKFVDILRKYYV